MAITKKMNKANKKNTKKAKARIGKEARKRRINEMLELREWWHQHLDEAHVKLQNGNGKTGPGYKTVSLIPIVDCLHCEGCSIDCSDMNNVCWQSLVKNDRAKNSAIHKWDLGRYWNEIDMQVKANYVTLLRINVGGDICAEDLPYIVDLAKKNPKTLFHLFTKSHDEVNAFLKERGAKEYSDIIPKNVKMIFSQWDKPINNEYEFPVAGVEGVTPDVPVWSYRCSDNCTACSMYGKGCPVMEKGDFVALTYH